jgi:hypothetical protein
MTVLKAFFLCGGQLISIWKGFFDTQHTENAKVGRKVESFVKHETYLQDA